MDAKSNNWYVLLTFCFLLGVTFLFFALASRETKDDEVKTSTLSETRTEPSVSVIDPIRGLTTAQITIVEFGDFSCEACEEMDTTLSQLLLLYPDDVRVVWKDAPNESLHPESVTAAIAARCADNQNLFWPYHDELFLRQANLNTETYLAIAEDLELDTDDFTKCTDSQDPLPRVEKSMEEVRELNLTATPTIFIGSERFVGAMTLPDLQNLVEASLE